MIWRKPPNPLLLARSAAGRDAPREGSWSEDEKKDLPTRVRPIRVRRGPIEPEVHKPEAQWVETRLLVHVEYG